MRIFETSADRLNENAACARLGEHWRGSIVETQVFEQYDRRLVADGRCVALVEIKCRSYPMGYFSQHRYMIGKIKVDELVRRSSAVKAAPIIMVACTDNDFLLDLRDTHYSVEMRRVNDRATTHQGVVMRDEPMCFFMSHRFLPITAISRII